MRWHWIKVFLLFGFTFFGQEDEKNKKENKDTIDYSFIKKANSYVLKKIVQNKSAIPHNCSKELIFEHPMSEWFLNNYKLSNGSILKSTDTLTYINWYLKTDANCLNGKCIHTENIAKLKINISSNTLILERLLCVKETKPLILLFKVIKCSAFEIILEDLQKLPYERYYYFQTKQTK